MIHQYYSLGFLMLVEYTPVSMTKAPLVNRGPQKPLNLKLCTSSAAWQPDLKPFV